MLATYGFEANPVPLALVYTHVFPVLALKLETLVTDLTFVHVLVVFVFVMKHGCWGIEVLLTQVALYTWVFNPEVFVKFFLRCKFF